MRPLVEQKLLPPTLRQKLIDFSDAIVPVGETGFLSLKSYVRSFTDIPNRGGGYRLKSATIDLMDATCPEVMRKNSGVQPPPSSKPKVVAFEMIFGPRSGYGKEVYGLIDKTVFERFVFIRMAES